MANFDELKESVWRCNLELVSNNLVIHTFGNVSGIDRIEGVVAIKPSGIPYNILKKEDIVLVDLNNKIVDGKLKPSIDTKTHTLLYKSFPHIGGIVHTHSTYATAWAQANKPIPCMGTTHADVIQSEIPCTDELSIEQTESDYEIETGNQIIKKISSLSPSDIQMILVSGHGPFTWGKSPEEALRNTIVLEEIAKIAMLTLNINPNIKRLSKHILDKHYLRKHGKNSYYGQN